MTKGVFRFVWAAAILVAGCSTGDGQKTDGAKDSAIDIIQDSPATMDVAAEMDDDGPDSAVEMGSDTGGGDALAALRERGKYLVDNVAGCPDCHTPKDANGPIAGMYLAGRKDYRVMGAESLPTRNLTNHETGLKNRTDEEIKTMFLDGKRTAATGGGNDAGSVEALNPFMPYYIFHNMKGEDADAIVAYLRTVPGVDNPIPRRTALFDVAAPADYLDTGAIPMPIAGYPQKDSALRGRYLTSELGLCIECHTQPAMAPSVLDTAHFFEGGTDFSSRFTALMIKPVSKNLTSDPQTGLGMWTVEDIIRVLKEGKAKDGSGICPPMPVGPNGAYGGLSTIDATDIANYIKSLPPRVNMIVDMCVFPPVPPADGGTEVGADGGTDGGSETDGETGSASNDALDGAGN